MTATETPTADVSRSPAGNPLGFGRMVRKEDARFVRGQGHYVDDLNLPGMLHSAILRSSYAHARIVSIDTSAAEAHPKVKAVITGKILETLNLAWIPTLSGDVVSVLATDKVRFQGQEVAFVVAEDEYSARDALELIEVEYEPLACGGRRQARPRRRRPDHPRRPRGADGQQDLRLGGRRRRRLRRGLRQRRGGGHRGHHLSPGPPGPDGDVRFGGPYGQGHRQADHLDHHPGPARPPDHLRPGRRAPRAQDPGHLPRHRRRVRQQGRHLPRLRAFDRRVHRDRCPGEMGGGPIREPDVHLVRPGLPHARGDRRDQGRQDPGPAGQRPGRPRGVQRGGPADQVPGRVLPHLHRLLRLPGGSLQGHRGVHQQGLGWRGLRLLVPDNRSGLFRRTHGRLPGLRAASRIRPSCG